MPLVSIRYTQAAIDKVSKEISLLAKIANLVFQVLAFLFYTTMVVLNISDTFKAILYSVLAIVTLAAYLTGLALSPKKDKVDVHRRSRFWWRFAFKVINYSARIVSVAYAFSFILGGNAEQVTLVLTPLATGLIVVNLLIDVLSELTKRYIRILRIGIQADIKDSGAIKAGEKMNSPLSLVEFITDKMANKKKEEDPLPKDEEKILEELKEKADAKEENKKEEKKRNILQNLRDFFNKD